MTTWLPGAHVVQLSPGAGGGRFSNFLGVVLHVNQGNTQDAFFKAYNNPNVNPASVVPNFQVHKAATQTGDAGVRQYLPFNWQPWCQAAGNQTYAAIETEGFVGQPLTDYQVQQIARIVKIYHDEMGMPYRVVDSPGLHGFGTHAMGGAAWGGHPCPGDIRAAQRQRILDLAQGGEDMLTEADKAWFTAQLAAAFTDADIDRIWGKSNAIIGQSPAGALKTTLDRVDADNLQAQVAKGAPTVDEIAAATAAAVVAALPPSSGGSAPTLDEITQAFKDVQNATKLATA